MSCRINQLEADIKMLQDRLIDRTAAYEAKDIKQVKRIQELENIIIKIHQDIFENFFEGNRY